MNSPKSIAWLLIAVLLTAGEAGCLPRRQPPLVNAPVVFTGPPTMTEVLAVVNRNSDPITQLQADNVKLSGDGMPPLRANIAIQRPRNFRMRAQFVGLGEVLDLGSNDELFWALVNAPQMTTNIPKAVYYARHDEFRQSQSSEMLPIKPDWLVQAFGLTHFDPMQQHEGPWQRGAGQLEFRSQIQTPEGPMGRITVVHETYGWILEQHMYDTQGKLVVSAIASEHRYYDAVGVSLPHHIKLQLPPPGGSFELDIETYSINQLRVDPRQLFTMPAYPGYRMINLAAQPTGSPSGSVPPAGMPIMPVQPQPPSQGYQTTGYRPQYRGYTDYQR